MSREQHCLFRNRIFFFCFESIPEAFFHYFRLNAGNRNRIPGRIFPGGYAAFSLKNRFVVGGSCKTQGRNYVV